MAEGDRPYIYQLPLDKKMDADILARLDDIPRARKAEWVRQAIRMYMYIERGNAGFVPATFPVNVAEFPSGNREEEKQSDEPADDFDF
jgi:hypothetical protein